VKSIARRKFRVVDLLALIVFIAIGLAWTRHFQNCEAGGESYPDTDGPFGPIPAFRHTIEVVNWWVISLSYCLAVVTVGLLILRLWVTPWNRLRSLTRLPGAVAGGAVALTVLRDLSYSAVEVLVGVTSGNSYDHPLQFTYLYLSGQNAGVAVLVAWALLAASGRWRREPGWLDSTGIALGIFWLGQSLLEQLVQGLAMLPV
jgi:hypothetical protein